MECMDDIVSSVCRWSFWCDNKIIYHYWKLTNTIFNHSFQPQRGKKLNVCCVETSNYLFSEWNYPFSILEKFKFIRMLWLSTYQQTISEHNEPAYKWIYQWNGKLLCSMESFQLNSIAYYTKFNRMIHRISGFVRCLQFVNVHLFRFYL